MARGKWGRRTGALGSARRRQAGGQPTAAVEDARGHRRTASRPWRPAGSPRRQPRGDDSHQRRRRRTDRRRPSGEVPLLPPGERHPAGSRGANGAVDGSMSASASTPTELLQLIEAVEEGELEPSAALEQLASLPFRDLGFARVDTHRDFASMRRRRSSPRERRPTRSSDRGRNAR